MKQETKRGVLIVLSGPSGTGKGTVCSLVRSHLEDAVRYSISATTRQPRAGEEHGREYFFFSKEEFEALRDQNGFLEKCSCMINRPPTGSAPYCKPAYLWCRISA